MTFVVDDQGIVRTAVGRRVEGVEFDEDVPTEGGLVKARLSYPMLTDENGMADGIDCTVLENRRRLHYEFHGITEANEKELAGRMCSPSQLRHKAFVFDRSERAGKRWKYREKWEHLPDPSQVTDTPKFPLGSVMVTRGTDYSPDS